MDFERDGAPTELRGGIFVYHCMAPDGTPVSLQRELATGRQYRDDDHHISHGLPHSKFPKPRQRCDADQAR